MKKNLKKYHEDNRAAKIFSSSSEAALITKQSHIVSVVDLAVAIANLKKQKVDIDLLKVLAEHHDDGRVDQYKLLGKFWDTEVSHFCLGVERVNKYITQNSDVEVDEEIDLLRKVMEYHGRMHLLPVGTTDEEKMYISIISEADTFENATSCISYLMREAEEDAKGYRTENPEMDQKTVTNPQIWVWLSNGEKFDKFKYCHTYADYILFAATLATNCIKQYGEMAKECFLTPAYGFESRLEGFDITFEKCLSLEDAERAKNILREMLGM